MSTDVSEIHAASMIRALMMEAALTSETSVDIQLRTWQFIPEDSELHTRFRENLKSHKHEISGSHGGEYESDCFMGYCAVVA
jgi:hypothetical protein